MADRRLISIYPDANVPLERDLKEFLTLSQHIYGEIPTKFNLDLYNNPIGIEVEAERYDGYDGTLYLWHTDEDHSLREGGVEFISTPLARTAIDYALHELKNIYDRTNLSFSHRCSIHVHCNASRLTLHQFQAMTAVYAMMENALFDFVGEARKENNFCYRLLDTEPWIIPGKLNTKYCAFNPLPLGKQMTVEFRHLEGTRDMKKIRRWIQLCAKLVGFFSLVEPTKAADIVWSAIHEEKVTQLLSDIYGDTLTVLDPRSVNSSIAAGELWAGACLSTIA